MTELPNVMGKVDAVDIGERKLTLQTEFFPRPEPRLETKVYLGGALKKVYTEPVAPDESDVQGLLHRVHQQRMSELVQGLKGLQPK
jgi:hypothetical protein